MYEIELIVKNKEGVSQIEILKNAKRKGGIIFVWWVNVKILW